MPQINCSLTHSVCALSMSPVPACRPRMPTFGVVAEEPNGVSRENWRRCPPPTPKKPLAQFVTFLQLLGISVYINYMYTTMESFQFTCAFSVCVCWYTVIPPTRHDKTVLSVSCLLCRCELHDCSERVQASNFLSSSCLESVHTAKADATQTRHFLSCLAWRCELALSVLVQTGSLLGRPPNKSLGYFLGRIV